MKFDTVIIGGGLSGLTAGIRLVEQGQRCAIVSSGQSALHFSSGSFDLLNNLPNGEEVDNPNEKVGELIKQAPNHPYAKLGEARFNELSKQAKDFLEHSGIPVQGNGVKNHFRITPMGTLKRTWLTMDNLAMSESETTLPYKKVAIFNVTGFLDFYPMFIADEFAKLGTESTITHFSLPDIDRLRRNPTELRATNIAWALDKENNSQELVKILKQKSNSCDAIIMPAIIGMKDANILHKLEVAVQKPIHIVPTLPPSIVGIRTQQDLHSYFTSKGGIYMLGDNVLKAEIENNRIKNIYSFNHKDIPFTADNYILATGSYFSQGLIAEQNKIIEPIFGLEISQSEKRTEWYDENMFERQNYQEFGVKTNESFNALKDGKAIENLYVSGAVLEAFNPIREGSGAGVSILSALDIADRIISKK